MDIVTAFEQVGTYRGTAVLCGTTHKTVKRVIDANRAGAGVGASTRWRAEHRRGAASWSTRR